MYFVNIAFTYVLVLSGLLSVILGVQNARSPRSFPVSLLEFRPHPCFSSFIILRRRRAVTRRKAAARSRTRPALR